jgi:hypothetical protein
MRISIEIKDCAFELEASMLRLILVQQHRRMHDTLIVSASLLFGQGK